MGEFRFKQFSVRNDVSAMKVGTDSVLLGAWTSTASGSGDRTGACQHDVLDVGTGTGVIALMTAQRDPSARILGIDIDEPSIVEASANFSASPWAARLSARLLDFRQIEGCFDLIVSNPPYFIDSLRSHDSRRNDARHTDTLSREELISGVTRLLSADGLFSLILPYEEGRHFIQEAESAGLILRRRCAVSTKEGKAHSRLMMEFSMHRTPSPVWEEHLVIHNSDGSCTSDYLSLAGDFYL